MTSMGFTTATASVTPAARPAVHYSLVSSCIYAICITRDWAWWWRTEECGFAGDSTGVLIREQLLVLLVGGESDGHLGDDTAQDGSEALVQTEGGFLLDNLNTGFHETTRLDLQSNELLRSDLEKSLGTYTRCRGSPRKLHADLNGV